jgi:hypothetical protein
LEWKPRDGSQIALYKPYGRYVERKPVRAGMVKDLKEYLWSSYRVYAYGKADGVTDRREIYDAIRKENGTRQRAYREYVCSKRDREEQEIRRKWQEGLLGWLKCSIFWM